MAAVNYGTIEQAIVDVLCTHSGITALIDAGQPLTITREPEAPTMEQCPMVQVAVTGSQRRRVRMGLTSPHDETVLFQVQVTAFSADSIADARCHAATIAQVVLAALDADPALKNTVCGLTANQVQIGVQPVDGWHFGTAIIRVSVLVVS